MLTVLTDALLKATKPPAKGRLEIADLRSQGLSFRITSNGLRSWTFRYRDPLTRSPHRYKLGPYPDISLSEARDKASDLRKRVANGGNPVLERTQARAEAPSKTFKSLSDRYLEEHARRKKRPRSIEEDERNLRLHVLPKWEKRAYQSIRRRDVITLLEGLIAAGKPTAANRVHSLVSKIFTFAIDADMIDAHPCARLAKRGKEGKRTRVLSDDELRLFWSGLDGMENQSRADALRLLLLTAARVSEVAGMRTAELSNLNSATEAAWSVPSERAKSHRPYIVPLSGSARATLRRLAAGTAKDAEFVFANVRGGPFSRFDLADAMRAFARGLDPKSSPAAASWAADAPSPHDLRRTVTTRLAALGVAKEVRQAILNHADTSTERRHYNQYDLLPEKRRALEAWAGHLAKVLKKAKRNAA